jgi:hypothetical protein
MKPKEAVLADSREVLRFLKGTLPVFHLSNIFFRDIQYGIQAYLKGRNLTVSYPVAETLAREFVARLEHDKVLVPVNRQTWMVNCEEFKNEIRKPH